MKRSTMLEATPQELDVVAIQKTPVDLLGEVFDLFIVAAEDPRPEVREHLQEVGFRFLRGITQSTEYELYWIRRIIQGPLPILVQLTLDSR